MAKKSSRKKKKVIKRLLLMSAFVLVSAFLMVQGAEYFMAQQARQAPAEQSAPTALQQPNTNITKQFESWSDYSGSVNRTINTVEAEVPEIQMIQVPRNDPVAFSYFDDVVFMGDSLADGFKVYAGSLNLKETQAVYLTQKSTTPKTFLLDSAMVNAGRGPVPVWPVIQQRQPGKMYITLGTNALMGMSPEELIENYIMLIDKVRENSPDTVIYVTTITPTTEKKALEEPRLSFDRIYQSNLLIAKMCRDKGLGLINLYEVLKNDRGYLREEIAAGDGYHLTPAGYNEWLNYLVTHTLYHPSYPYI